MFATGAKQTCASAPHMSAFGGKADIAANLRHVCFCPNADKRSPQFFGAAQAANH